MKTLADFGKLKPAEKKLLAAVVSGEGAVISLTRPDKKTSKNTVRASFIRWLALGGDAQHPLHAHGVQLVGAWVTEQLDLEGAQVNAELLLGNCHIEAELQLIGMRLTGKLNLGGSQCVGMRADGAEISGGVFLRNGFTSTGEIRLLGTKIGGDLDFSNAKLNVEPDKFAINADGAKIAGNVFLHNSFECNGIVRLVASEIKGGLSFTHNKTPARLDLSNAHAAFMQTHIDAWAEDSNFNNFKYDEIREDSWTTQDYLAWLNKQDKDFYGNKTAPELFKPQPWQHLIKTLRRMGHKQTADEIAMAFERQLYDIGKVNGWFKRCLHRLFGLLAGYGYRPLRLVKVMFGIWLLFGGVYMAAAYHGVFAPSDPLVFQKVEYKNCHPVDSNGAFKASLVNNANGEESHNWYTCSKLEGEYTTFSPFAYSLDVILPLVDLGQEKSWGTFIDTPNAKFYKELFNFSANHITRLLIWFEILFGWVASLLLVAVLSGLTNKEDVK